MIRFRYVAAVCAAIVLLLAPAVAHAQPVWFVYERDLAQLSVKDGVVADFDEDGHDDLALTVGMTGFRTALSDGAGGYTILPEDPRLSGTGGTIAAADFNGDGHIDLVVGSGDSGNPDRGARLQVWLNDGHAGWTAGPYLETGGLVWDVAVADFDDDGAMDVVATDLRNMHVWRGDGTGSFVKAAAWDCGGRTFSVVAGDFDNDGLPDVATTTDWHALIFRNLGGFSFELASMTDIPSDASGADIPEGAAETGDFDADGNLDLAAPYFTGGVVVYFGDGAGGVGFVNHTPWVVPVGYGGEIDVTDLNGDGYDDIVHRSYWWDTYVYLSDGCGAFRRLARPMSTYKTLWFEVVRDTFDGPPVFLSGLPLSRWTIPPIDVRPPVTTAEVSPAAPSATGWYQVPVTLTLTGTDDAGGWGLGGVFYALNDEPEELYSGPVQLAADGIYDVYYWSVDYAENFEPERTLRLCVDTHRPVTTAMPRGPEPGRVTFDLIADDTGSGIASTSYRLDGVSGAGTVVSCSALGSHKLEYWSVDRAGNTEVLKYIWFTVLAEPAVPGYLPVYRFYNFRKGVHFYTASPVEKADVVKRLSSTYRYEGIAYYVHTANPANDTPLWRFYNLRTGTHFYTASPAEKADILAKLATTYRLEGEAYRVCSTPVAGSTPVYRFFNFRKGVHFYTASEAEKQSVLTKLGWTYRLEGAAFHLAP